MRKLCVALLFILVIAGCSSNNDKYEITGTAETSFAYADENSGSKTDFEKSQNVEKQLILRLQSTISLLDNVSDTAITITTVTTSEKSKKDVSVVVAIDKDKALTEEEKQGIINIVANSINGVDAENVSISEK